MQCGCRGVIEAWDSFKHGVTNIPSQMLCGWFFHEWIFESMMLNLTFNQLKIEIFIPPLLHNYNIRFSPELEYQFDNLSEQVHYGRLTKSWMLLCNGINCGTWCIVPRKRIIIIYQGTSHSPAKASWNYTNYLKLVCVAIWSFAMLWLLIRYVL